MNLEELMVTQACLLTWLTCLFAGEVWGAERWQLWCEPVT